MLKVACKWPAVWFELQPESYEFDALPPDHLYRAASADDADADADVGVLCREARCHCVLTVSCTMRDIVHTV